MIIVDNEEQIDLNLPLLEKIYNSLEISRDIELLIVDDQRIKEINTEHRQIDKATDVLSFPLENFPHLPLGSIVISYNRAQEVSKELGHTLSDEITLLFIHGLLHLLGFDHEIDNGQMREKEKEIIDKFDLPISLILRNKGE